MIQGVIATPVRQDAHFCGSHQPPLTPWGRTRPQHLQGTGALMAQAVYVPGLTSGSGMGGSAMDGTILRRTITMGEPQQVHSSWGRGVGVVAGVGGPTGCLNTSNFNSAIKRLLLGCKKPKLRARRNPLGNTCCMSSHKKVAPLTVHCAVFLVLLSR